MSTGSNIESNIRDDEKVLNTDREFGEVSEQEGYYVAYRIKIDGSIVPLAFTDKDLLRAEKTAFNNMEDIPGKKSLLEKVFWG